MSEGAISLIGTIVETEDHYGTCWVQVDWPDHGDHEHFPASGMIWLPIPDVVNDPLDIQDYEGKRVSINVALIDGGK